MLLSHKYIVYTLNASPAGVGTISPIWSTPCIHAFLTSFFTISNAPHKTFLSKYLGHSHLCGLLLVCYANVPKYLYPRSLIKVHKQPFFNANSIYDEEAVCSLDIPMQVINWQCRKKLVVSEIARLYYALASITVSIGEVNLKATIVLPILSSFIYI